MIIKNRITPNQLKSHVGNGRILEVIDLLKNLISSKVEISIENELVLIEYRYKSLSNEERLSLISRDKLLIESNVVVNSLLQFIDSIDFDKLGPEIENQIIRDYDDTKIDVEISFLVDYSDKEKVILIVNKLMECSNDVFFKLKRLRKGSTIIKFEITQSGYVNMVNNYMNGNLEKLTNSKIAVFKVFPVSRKNKEKSVIFEFELSTEGYESILESYFDKSLGDLTNSKIVNIKRLNQIKYRLAKDFELKESVVQDKKKVNSPFILNNTFSLLTNLSVNFNLNYITQAELSEQIKILTPILNIQELLENKKLIQINLLENDDQNKDIDNKDNS